MSEGECIRLDTMPGATHDWVCCQCSGWNHNEDEVCVFCGHRSCCSPLEVGELELRARQWQEIEKLALKSGTFVRCGLHGTVFHNPDSTKRKAVYAYCIAGFNRGDPIAFLFSDVDELKDMIKVVRENTAKSCLRCDVKLKGG